MRSTLLLLLCQVPVSLFCQVVVGRPWTLECGVSTNSSFKNSTNINLRYTSPRFKWSEDWTEEEELHPEKFRNTRLMLELIYTPPLKVVCTGMNVQFSLLKTKRLNLDLYGGMKFFFIPGPDFITIPFLKDGREIWYMNLGLLFQLNLGIIAPFVDIGRDGILTIGTELHFHKIYRKPKKRYKLHARPGSTRTPPKQKQKTNQAKTR